MYLIYILPAEDKEGYNHINADALKKALVRKKLPIAPNCEQAIKFLNKVGP